MLNPHAKLIKTRLKAKSVNDVGSMSLYAISSLYPDYYLISLLNSSLIFDYYRQFINNSVNIQMNDIRQLPIIIPSSKQLENFKVLFDKALAIKKKQFSQTIEKSIAVQQLENIQEDLDEMVLELYDIEIE